MRFKSDSFLRDVQLGTPVAPETTNAQREELCRACEWLGERDATGPKCFNPACGCPLNSSRINPWLNLRRCGAGKWTR